MPRENPILFNKVPIVWFHFTPMTAATGAYTLTFSPFTIPPAKSRTTISFALRSRRRHEIHFPRIEKNRKSRFPVSSRNGGVFSRNLDCTRVLPSECVTTIITVRACLVVRMLDFFSSLFVC